MKNRIFEWLSHRLPHGLVYFAAIRMFCHATTGEYSMEEVPSVTIMDALNRWEDKANVFRP